jgi:hypothetical protein
MKSSSANTRFTVSAADANACLQVTEVGHSSAQFSLAALATPLEMKQVACFLHHCARVVASPLRHERGLFSRQVGGKILIKLGGVEISEAVCGFLYRGTLAEVTWKALSVICLILASIWLTPATYTNPNTEGSVPASVTTAPP